MKIIVAIATRLHVAIPCLALLGAGPVQAQTYPDKPVRLVISQAPASSADNLARYLGARLTAGWGQQVIVENKPGANGIIGLDYVAKARADGYTLALSAPSSMTINQFVYKKMPFKPLEDFAGVTQLTSVSFALLVNPSLPVKSVQDLVALAKQRPGALNYSSPGIGNLGHLAAELLSVSAGIKMQHVPNKGDTPALLDVMTGQTQLMFVTLPAALPHIRSGKLRLLAVAGKTRIDGFPDTPTIAESGFPDVVVEGWTGVVVPTGTPPDVISKLQKDFATVLANPEVRTYLAGQGQSVVASTSESYKEFMRLEALKWSKVVTAINLTVD
ncbi:MAG: tripartite tricarboxylate transporter substrate binding protein [Pseudomonadota bacterium]